jgi:hypothetical protein
MDRGPDRGNNPAAGQAAEIKKQMEEFMVGSAPTKR